MWTADPRGTSSEYWDLTWSRPYIRYESHHQLFWSIIRERAMGSILDMGCGSASCWKGYEGDLTGFDFSPQAIIEAKKNAKGNFFVADIEDHKIEKKFDTVVLCGIVNYYPDLTKIKEQIKKVSGKGTKVFITINVIQDTPDREWNIDRIEREFLPLGTVTAGFYEKVGWFVEIVT